MPYSKKPISSVGFSTPARCTCGVARGPKGITSRILYTSGCPIKSHRELAEKNKLEKLKQL